MAPRRSGSWGTFPKWALSRVLCTIGTLFLVQNLALLWWSAGIPDISCAGPSGLAVGGAESWREAPSRGVPAQLAVVGQVAKGQTQAPVSPPTQPPVVAGDIAAPRLATVQPQPPSTVGEPPRQAAALFSTAPTPPRTPGSLLPAAGAASGQATSSFPGVLQLQRSTSLADDLRREDLRLLGKDTLESEHFRLCVGLSATNDMARRVLERLYSSSSEHHALVTTVVLLTGGTYSWAKNEAERLKEEYQDDVNRGGLHVLYAPIEMYPRLGFCPPFCPQRQPPMATRTFAKTNVDNALLMYYSAPLAPYYLQLEGDISFQQGWAGKLQNWLSVSYPTTWLSKENAPWRVIDFVNADCLGLLFQGNEVGRLAQFLLLFYDQLPCRQLVSRWHGSMTQWKMIEYFKGNVPLFNRGASVPAQVAPAANPSGSSVLCGNHRAPTCADCPQGNGAAWCHEDCLWNEQAQECFQIRNRYNNPMGVFRTDMTILDTFSGSFAYFPGGEPANRRDVCNYKVSKWLLSQSIKRCWFWAKQVRAGQFLAIVFQSDIDLKAVLFNFGHDAHSGDILQHAAVEVAPSSFPLGSGENAMMRECGRFARLGEIVHTRQYSWEVGMDMPPALPVSPIRCVRVVVLDEQSQWLIVNNIFVQG